MKLSVITVVYNNDKTISEAINSVLSQNYDEIEYIIIDGASRDNTLTIIKEYQSRISKFVSEPDTGLYDAMNKGVRLATGDVIGILNSDDIYQDRNVISDIMYQFNSDEKVDLVYGDLVYVKQDDTNKIVRNWRSNKYYPNFFEDGNVPPHPSLFVKTEVYKESGLFNLDFKLAADYEFMLRIFKKHSFKSKYINRIIIRMRLGGATNQSFRNIWRQNVEILRAWNTNELRVPFLLMPLRLFKRIIQFIY
jgi:glycosyltransferase